MYTLWSYYQSRQKRSMVERTAEMDPKVRLSLAAHIEETNLAGEDQNIEELDRALEECRNTMAKFEETDRFLSTRLSSYRTQLNARNRTNNSKGHTTKQQDATTTTDEEAPDPEILSREQQQKNEAALAKVRMTQTGILADMETLRRRIQDLEQKRNDILETRQECKEFLVAVAVAEEQEAVEDLQQKILQQQQQQRKREKEQNNVELTTTEIHNDDPLSVKDSEGK